MSIQPPKINNSTAIVDLEDNNIRYTKQDQYQHQDLESSEDMVDFTNGDTNEKVEKQIETRQDQDDFQFFTKSDIVLVLIFILFNTKVLQNKMDLVLSSFLNEYSNNDLVVSVCKGLVLFGGFYIINKYIL